MGVAIFGVLAAAVTLGVIGAWRVRPSIIAREAARAAEGRAREEARQVAIVAEGIRQAATSSTGIAGQPGPRTLTLTDEEYAQIKAVLDRERQAPPRLSQLASQRAGPHASVHPVEVVYAAARPGLIPWI